MYLFSRLLLNTASRSVISTNLFYNLNNISKIPLDLFTLWINPCLPDYARAYVKCMFVSSIWKTLEIKIFLEFFKVYTKTHRKSFLYFWYLITQIQRYLQQIKRIYINSFCEDHVQEDHISIWLDCFTLLFNLFIFFHSSSRRLPILLST